MLASVRTRGEEGPSRAGLLEAGSEKKLQEILTAKAVMSRDLAEDRGECPDPQWIMPRDGDVVLAVLDGGQAEMAAGLTGDLIAEASECTTKVIAGQAAGQPHGAMTSSRTKCRRRTLGSLPSSKWQRTASRIWPCRLSRSSASVKMASPRARAV